MIPHEFIITCWVISKSEVIGDMPAVRVAKKKPSIPTQQWNSPLCKPRLNMIKG